MAPSVEHNATAGLQKVAQSGQQILDIVDQDIYWYVQEWINRIYGSHYGAYLAKSFLGIPLGNWVAAFGVFFLIYLFRKFLTRVVLRFLLHLARKTETVIDDLIIRELRSPIRFLFVIIGMDLFFHFLFLRHNPYVELLLSSMFIVDLYWMLYAFTPAIRTALHLYGESTGRISYELGNFIIRMVRLLIVALGIISLLYNFGVNVTAFVASLGLVGMAFALAAKDTAANLFGSIALMLDQSIKVGEWIRVNGVEGIVEDIGMRTTKIRTFEKSFVVVPNSIVANSNIENFSRRGIRRIKMVVGLTYDTMPTQIRAITEAIRAMLASHPGIAHDQTLLVRFDRFGDSALGIFVYTFTNTSDWEKYLEIREDVHIRIMEIVREHGSDFAFPSQSIYVEKLPDFFATVPAK
ncbi:mechanosensitive ion channel family protein [Nitratifractor sp.]